MFVNEKSGQLRAIIDARRVNRRVKAPPRTELGSVTALSQAELFEYQTLYFAASGIDDCVHHFRPPKKLQEHLGLPGNEAKYLRLKSIWRNQSGP